MKSLLILSSLAILMTGASIEPALAKNRFISSGLEARIKRLLPEADTTNLTGGQAYIIDQIFLGGPEAEYRTDNDRRDALRILFKKVPGGLTGG